MTPSSLAAPTLLVAEDDPDERVLARDAIGACGLGLAARFVADGEELIDYLRRRGRFAATDCPRPDLIVLDLAMPRMNGLEVLGELKRDPGLRHIPTVLFSNSVRPDDVRRGYEAGADSYIPKPATYGELIDLFGLLARYWLAAVRPCP
jgi:CheY-like chemotaxis protein